MFRVEKNKNHRSGVCVAFRIFPWNHQFCFRSTATNVHLAAQSVFNKLKMEYSVRDSVVEVEENIIMPYQMHISGVMRADSRDAIPLPPKQKRLQMSTNI